MADLTFSQLEGYWIAAGGSSAMAPVMAAIALAESSGNPNATNPTDNNGTQTSWGLWQISNGNHSEPASNWNDPLENAKLAVGKLASQGLSAWGTYTSGAYKRFLQSGVAPSTPSGTNAQSASATTGAESTGWLSTLLGGASDSLEGQLGPEGGVLGSVIGDVFGPVANVFKDLDSGLTDAMHAVLWLINPANWVRIFAGIAGSASLIVGLVFLVKAA